MIDCRKRIAAVCCICLAACVAATPHRAAGRDIGKNPSMTDGDGTPAGWDLSSYKKGNVTLTRDTTTFKSAPASLCVATDSDAGAGFVHQYLDVDHGMVHVTFWAKVAGSFKSANLALQVFDNNWKQIGWLPLADVLPASDWQSFNASASVPDAAAHVLLGLSINGNGKAWLDDVSVQTDSASESASTAAPADEAGPLPVSVPMTDASVRLIGRFDTSKSASPRCAWSASTVTIHFKGTAANVLLSDGPNARYQIVVDGTPTDVLKSQSGVKRYRVAADLPDAEHTVALVKRGEPIFGATTFNGFELSESATPLPAAAAPEHRIEVVGDSISCGYGVLAKSQNEHFSAETEDAYLTYGAVAARTLNADYHCVAWSGRTMWPKNTMPEIYDRILPFDKQSHWDASKFVPQVVVVTLGTNDFAGKSPDEQGWTQAYEAFLKHLRSQYPDAMIYCATSPMMFGKPRTTLSEYLSKIVNDLHIAGNAKVKPLEFAAQDGKNGIGADWHPSVKTQQMMADVFVRAIQADLHW